MNRRRGLGSGLDALIPARDVEAPTVREIAVDAIRQNRSQPRTRFDEQALEDLAASIREHGVIQPLIVTDHADGGYELIAGERRLRAARLAGLTHVPALVKEATPQQLLELALVENVQRADLNPLEEGMAYQTLKDEFGLKDDEIAQRVGKNRVTVANARRLIKLIPDAQSALLAGEITAGHGRALLRLEQIDQQAAALALVVRRGLSVRETERLTELAASASVAPATRQALLMGAISISQAESLLRISDQGQQALALDLTLAQGPGARELELLCDLVAEGAAPAQALEQIRGRPAGAAAPATAPTLGSHVAPEHAPGGPKPERTPPSEEDAAAQRMFEEALGTPVHIVRGGGAIRLIIKLYNDEQLQSLYNLIAGALT